MKLVDPVFPIVENESTGFFPFDIRPCDEDGAPLTRSDVGVIVGSCIRACVRSSHMSDMGSRAKVSTSNLMFDTNV